MRPLSVEEFGQVMDKAEQSKLGAAWEAIKDDPWGTLAMVGVVAAGVGCASSARSWEPAFSSASPRPARSGIATGTFNPRLVALSGAIGAIPGGNTLRGAMMLGAATGAGETVAGSLINGQGFPSPQQLLLGTVAGTAGGGLGYGASQGLARLRTGSGAVTPNATAALDHSPTPPVLPEFDGTTHGVLVTHEGASLSARVGWTDALSPTTRTPDTSRARRRSRSGRPNRRAGPCTTTTRTARATTVTT